MAAPCESLEQLRRSVERDGFALITDVFDAQPLEQLIVQIEQAIQNSDAAISGGAGKVTAARNILTEWPTANTIWRQPRLQELLTDILGSDFVSVRALYFDKHPDNSWFLPWHKDMTIAVKNNSLPTTVFSKPTTKSGVPHVEGSTEILENMLTLRIHLDEVTMANGPLEVIPGSHLTGKQNAARKRESKFIVCSTGDVLAMRPLICHRSGKSKAGTRLHRRILHFEFSGDPALPDGYQWFYGRDIALAPGNQLS